MGFPLSDNTQSIPDQSHINKVRDALSIRPISRATVMVGSGFSRNAQKARFDASDMPMWADIAEELFHQLYPESATGGSYGAGVVAPSVDNVLRLAQEYETAFGRSDLYRLLDQLVRYTEFKPGEAHVRLLKLPWRDVFTTNWDMLLEDGIPKALERPYRVVQNAKQLPIVSQPRIIKLHGSFPSQFPLIVTEEDYRTYPSEFAPFVNTVQQAMMESVFFLIGFSGDDPNFLHWSGWVRDNLGEAALKIYLAGWLDLSPHQRRMLEARGVVPIDVANHPKASTWPVYRRHQYATDWLLHTLEPSRRYDDTTWPSPPEEEETPIPDHLKPVMRIVPDVPLEELERIYPQAVQTGDIEPADRIRDVVGIWAHNRKLYPGWLVFPSGSEHFNLSHSTGEWESPILIAFPHFTLVEQLMAIREIVWRKAILLEPISFDLEAGAKQVLHEFDCQNHFISGTYISRDDWEEIREAWVEVTLALITDARFDCDLALFEQRLNSLKPFLNDNPNIMHHTIQERCLWAVYSLDFDELNNLLDSWAVENCDPIWMLRKAALLTEAHRYDDSNLLVQEAINSIRQEPVEGKSIAIASREGWALVSTISRDNQQTVFRELAKLASLGCDAASEINYVRRAITRADKQDEAPSFDIGVRQGTRVHISNLSWSRLIAAYRAIRLLEVAGVPPVNNPGRNTGIPLSMVLDLLTLAADQLVATNPKLSIRLVLRACKYDGDKILQRVLSRGHLARLSDDTVAELAQLSIRAIKFALPRLFTSHEPVGQKFWVERMRVALEVLSRLVLRLPQDMVNDVVDLGLECYLRDRVAEHVFLRDPLGNLLQRAWEALSKEHRAIRAFDLLAAPMEGLDNFPAGAKCPNPAQLISAKDLPSDRTASNERQYQDVVSFLIRGLLGSDEARRQATFRLIPLVISDSLTDEESSNIATALWCNIDPIQHNVSGSGTVLDWLYFILPEMEEGQAERSFRLKWLSPTRQIGDWETDYASNVLVQVGRAVAGLRGQGRQLVLSVVDEQHIATQIQNLVEMFSSNSVSFNFGIGATIRPVSLVAAEITIPKHVAENLFQRVESLIGTQMHSRDLLIGPLYDIRIGLGFAVVPGLVKALPERFETLTLWLRTGLASEDDARVRGTMAALMSWLSASGALKLPPVPEDLIREVGAIIASDRRVALADALTCAKLVFDIGSELHRDTIRPLVLQGLSYLADKLTYDSQEDTDGDIHTLRMLCAQLATKIASHGLKDDATVAKWLDIARSDPFPETRNIIISYESS